MLAMLLTMVVTCEDLASYACLMQNALPAMAHSSMGQVADTSGDSCCGCTAQHDIGNPELQWLWEEAQAALQDAPPPANQMLPAACEQQVAQSAADSFLASVLPAAESTESDSTAEAVHQVQ